MFAFIIVLFLQKYKKNGERSMGQGGVKSPAALAPTGRKTALDSPAVQPPDRTTAVSTPKVNTFDPKSTNSTPKVKKQIPETPVSTPTRLSSR
jgi:hypothetical protein